MSLAFRWEHRQPELGLVAVSDAALARAAALDWSSEPMNVRVAHFRALMVRSIVDAAILTMAPMPPAGTTSWQAPDFARVQYRSPWGPEVAQLLLRTPLVLLGSNGRAAKDAWQNVITSGGQPALPELGEAGNPLAFIAGGAVVIVGAAVWTVAMCYVAQKTAEVIDNELVRRDSARKMLATQGAVLQMVENHTAAELAAGRPLGLSVAESDVLDALLATHEKLALEHGRPIPSPFPTGADVAKSGTSIVGWLAAAAALGLAAYYGVFKSPRSSASAA